MSGKIFDVKLPLHKLMEAAERLHEIRPFTPRRLCRQLRIERCQAICLLRLFMELNIVYSERTPKHGYTPMVSPEDAVQAVIHYLFKELCTVRVDGADDEILDIIYPSPFVWVPGEETSIFDGLSAPNNRDDPSEACPSDQSSKDADILGAMAAEDKDHLREAVETACARERIGTGALQRTLRIGYIKAAGLMDTMESLGIVGPDPGNKTGRKVLLSLEEALTRLPAEED